MALDANGNYVRLEDSGYNRAQIESFIRNLASTYDASFEPSDVDNTVRKLQGGAAYMTAHGGNPQKAFDELTESYKRRGAPTGHRTEDSQARTGTYAEVNADPRNEPGYKETRVLTEVKAPVASIVTTGVPSLSNNTEPTTGPIGLAYPADPVNYATGQVSPSQGYSDGLHSGIYETPLSPSYLPQVTTGPGLMAPATPAAGLGDTDLTTWLLIGGVAVAAYFLMKS